jgi:hypothetical protein
VVQQPLLSSMAQGDVPMASSDMLHFPMDWPSTSQSHAQMPAILTQWVRMSVPAQDALHWHDEPPGQGQVTWQP